MRRSRRRLADYRVMTIDEHVVGCVALHEYPAEGCAEVACLYVKQSHEGLGYGAELVRQAEALAAGRGIGRVFALTTGAADFFQQKLGYRETDPGELPAARRGMLEASGRDSRVFVKETAEVRPAAGG